MKTATSSGLRTTLVTIAVLVVPALLALQTVQTPRPVLPVSECVSPQGYTYSLAFFFVPVAAMLFWLRRQSEFVAEWRACRLTLILLVTLGYLLDILFGNTFFTFENPEATIGFFVPGWDAEKGWSATIPLEEFGFYLFGLMLAMVGYLWADLYWLRAYHVETGRETEVLNTAKTGGYLRVSSAIGVALIAVAAVYKTYGPHPYHDGFPGWFAFIVLVGIVPTFAMLPSVKNRINWRAFQLTFLFMLLISVVWEVTLAVPYRWWGYRPEQMMGLMIGPWSNLPIEQPILWLLVSWQAITSYEFARAPRAVRSPKIVTGMHPIPVEG